MNFSFEYTDVSSLGKYKQTESFVFGRNTSNELYVSQTKDDLLSAPEEVL